MVSLSIRTWFKRLLFNLWSSDALVPNILTFCCSHQIMSKIVGVLMYKLWLWYFECRLNVWFCLSHNSISLVVTLLACQHSDRRSILSTWDHISFNKSLMRMQHQLMCWMLAKFVYKGCSESIRPYGSKKLSYWSVGLKL